MKSFILAAIAAVSLGVGAANAATTQSSQKQSQIPQTQTHRPNYYNWLEGGGG